MTFSNLITFVGSIVTSFTSFITFFTTPILKLLESANNSFTDFLLNALNFVGLTDFLSQSNITLFSLLIGSSLIVFVVVTIIKWLIP